MKINGHLQDFSLSDLLKILTNLRESGCLTIDFQPEPGVFYFNRGQLVEGRLGDARAEAAVQLALSLPKTSFQFDDDVEPPESLVPVPPAPTPEPPAKRLHLSLEPVESLVRPPEVATEILPELSLPSTKAENPEQENVPVPAGPPVDRKDIRLIYPQQSFSYIRRQRLITAAVAILLIGVPAAVAVTVHLRTRLVSARPESVESIAPQSNGEAAPKQTAEEKSAATQTTEPSVVVEPSPSPAEKKDDEAVKDSADDTPKIISEAGDDRRDRTSSQETSDAHVKRPPPDAKTVLVMVQVTNGRVTEAWVKDPRKGSEAVEAAAVRMARQRRYPATVTRTEAVAIGVTINH